MRIKKEYCNNHPYIAWYNYTSYVTIYLHGRCNNKVYLSIQYGDFGKSYHRIQMNCNDVAHPYFKLWGKKFYLNEFILRYNTDCEDSELVKWITTL